MPVLYVALIAALAALASPQEEPCCEGPARGALHAGDDAPMRAPMHALLSLGDRAGGRLAAGEDVLALYDAGEILIYDEMEDAFHAHAAADRSEIVLAAGRAAVLAYDGDDLIGYCGGGRWVTASISDGRAMTPARRQAEPTLLDGSRHWVLDAATCRIEGHF